MKKIINIIYACLLVFSTMQTAHAQETADPATLRIGIFAPLYLDSAFSGEKYLYTKKFPRFTLQGFDFVQGAMMAADSFPIAGTGNKTETTIFDTKSDSLPLEALIASGKLDQMDLLIGSVKDEAFLQLSQFAKDKRIPFISVTYPNDGNNTDNRYLTIISSTLKTHCEGIFSYLLQNHSGSKIIHVRPTGSQEERVTAYFNAINQRDGHQLLKMKSIILDSNYYMIKTLLDSTRKNVIVAGSLDEDFAASLAYALAPLRKKYDLMLIGMPNWESFSFMGKSFKPHMKDFPVYYTSSFFNPRTDSISRMIETNYFNQFKGKPSDFFYKGFESFYVFSRLLQLYGADLSRNITDQSFTLFTEYNLSPVNTKGNNRPTDYYENKHIYFIRRINGNSSKDWTP